MKFEIRDTSWFKRRAAPTNVVRAIEARVPDFKFEQDHFCDMFVTYEDGTEKKYLSRVLQNHITKKWCVDAMHHIADVIEE